MEAAENLSGSVLLIGFGRFGQIVSQPLLARGHSVSIIETNTEAIRDAEDFDFKVHYGDGSRLDILHAAGAENAKAIVIADNDAKAASTIAELARQEFPMVTVLARALDREHAIELVHSGVDYQVRETFESALKLGERALVVLGDEPEAATELMADIRRRDAERFEIETVGGIYAGRDLIHGNARREAP